MIATKFMTNDLKLYIKEGLIGGLNANKIVLVKHLEASLNHSPSFYVRMQLQSLEIVSLHLNSVINREGAS